jgi:Flp pilus assembly protein TadB
MLHTALIIGCLAIAAIAFAVYMWDTRAERKEFAHRVERAERIRRSMSGGRMPRGGSQP